ncbi:MAG TPA: HD domain-containing phosphohydrolase [Planctomycetota bacterium]|nr:HD domain-containing phosphohydrolase [Planctomycetota bacterium]
MNVPKILVVDDDAVYRRYLTGLLIPEGYELAEAKDGGEALDFLSKSLPDLILLDLEMPRVDGYAVCRKIKESPRTRLIPVVVVTSLEWLPAKILALRHLADDFLSKPVNSLELIARVKSLLSIKQFTDELENAGIVLKGIARAAEKRDAYTGGHGHRVSQGAARLGVHVGLQESDTETLMLGALLHDLGKIAIPDAILMKSGGMTPAEMELMKSHPVLGEDLCKPMRTMQKLLPIIRSHHEHLDGSGYPDGLSGPQLPLLVRIVSVVDVYDALTTVRSYRHALSSDDALRLLREESIKGWWDPEVVEAWSDLILRRTEPALAV